jgi:N4-gp56 family major capsid protein
MADAYTGTAAVDYDQAAYDRMAYPALRAELYFDGVADVRPTAQAMPGTTVIFTIQSDLSAATTALGESTDVDAVALADTQVTVTLVEQGNAAITTAKIRGTSFVELDPIVANVIGYNAGLSIDSIAVNELKAGSNATFAGQAVGRTTVIPTDLFAGNDARKQTAALRTANVATINGDYVGFIHPQVSYDFRGSTGAANWRDPRTYSDPGNIYNGEAGTFENIRWIETPRAPVVADAGSSTTLTDVYLTLVVGRQSLAKAYSMQDGNGPYPKIVPGPVVDHLRRFVPWGWYWFGGYKRFREAAIRRVESASSIGTNA